MCMHAGPDLGPLASLMVAPEEGSWRVDEVTVSSSRSRHTDRCDPLLPERPAITAQSWSPTGMGQGGPSPGSADALSA